MSSTFNADQFLQTRSQGQMDTKYPTCPAGEYRGMVDKLAIREQEIKKGGRTGEVATILEVTWEVLDERVRDLLQVDRVTARQSIFLDLTPEGQLDLGKAKNIQLGKTREALGQNNPDKDWFPNMLLGSIGKITVDHTPNEKDPSSPYANVKSVAPLS